MSLSPSQALDKIIADHNNQPWEVEDPGNKDQCFDLVLGLCDLMGIPREAIRHLYAYQIFTLAGALTRQYFDVIPYYPGFVPQKADIGVYGTVVGSAGHTCAELGGGNAQLHTSFDQNWDTANHHAPDGSPICRKVNHTYNGFLGVLRPKNQATNNQGDDMATLATTEMVDILYTQLVDRKGADASAHAVYVGKPIWDVITTIFNTSMWSDYKAWVRDTAQKNEAAQAELVKLRAQSAPPAPITDQSALDYLKNRLDLK